MVKIIAIKPIDPNVRRCLCAYCCAIVEYARQDVCILPTLFPEHGTDRHYIVCPNCQSMATVREW